MKDTQVPCINTKRHAKHLKQPPDGVKDQSSSLLTKYDKAIHIDNYKEVWLQRAFLLYAKVH